MELLLQLPIYFMVWSSLMVLSLSIFRFRIKNYVPQLLISTLVLTHISFLVQYFKLDYLMTAIQPLFLFYCFYLLFKTSTVNSIILVISAYSADIVIEILLNFVLSQVSNTEFTELMKKQVYLRGLLMAFINIVLSIIMNRLRFGFSFIPSRRTFHSKMPRSIHYASLVSIVIVAMDGFSLFLWGRFVIATYSITIAMLFVIMYLFYRKELAD